MHWQEYVLFIGQMIFNISLLPSIFSKNKPAFPTSLITSTVLLIYIFIYGSLSLWITAIAVGSTGVLWGVLAYQSFKLKKKGK